ncbi:MAG: hypothetical protein FJY65_08550, partial [Calditrichaeota bacterium]|nr:hypothetical protein [Calditrichota bacterium]
MRERWTTNGETSMNKLPASIVALLILCSAALTAAPRSLDLQVVASSSSVVRAHFDLPPLGELWTAPEASGLDIVWISDERPIAALMRWIAVPAGQRAELTIETRISYRANLNPQSSAVQIPLNLQELQAFRLEPAAAAQIGEPVFFRGQQLVPLLIYPVQLEADGSESGVVNQSLDFSVHFYDDPNQRALRSVGDAPASTAARFVDNLVINPPARDPIGGQFPHIGHILIIYNQNLAQRAYLDSLANWKRQMGYRVSLQPVDPTDPLAIRQMIRENYYFIEDPVQDLLIIGPDAQNLGDFYIPGYRVGAFTGDHYYGVMVDGEGERIVPELTVGRMYAETTSELAGVIKRSIRFERELFLDDENNRAWFKRALYTAEDIEVAGGQFVPSMIHLGRWVATRWRQMGIERIDTFFARDYSREELNQRVGNIARSGVSMILSRGWLDGCSQNAGSVDTQRKHPFLSAMTCLSWDRQTPIFKDSPLNRPKGPIGDLCMHGLTNTKYNNSILGGQVRAMRYFNISRTGWIQLYSKMQAWSDYRVDRQVWPDLERVISVYTLLGD